MALLDKLFPAQKAPAGLTALAPEDMARYLNTLDDGQWGLYAFSRDPIEGKFTLEQKLAYTRAANACGEMWAEKTADEFGARDPLLLTQKMGLTLKTPCTPIGGGQVLFAQFVEPDEITIFTDCLDKASVLGDLLPPREELLRIILAHELFHAVEERHKSEIYTRTERVELWRKPFSNRSPIACLSEIAAMSFARQLLGLSFHPYTLDVLLVWPYGRQAATDLFLEIKELTEVNHADCNH